MVPPTSLQHAATEQCRVQIPPHMQRCANGATNFSSTCSYGAVQGASLSPPAAVCRWCNHFSSEVRNADLSPPTCGSLSANVRISLQHRSSRCRCSQCWSSQPRRSYISFFLKQFGMVGHSPSRGEQRQAPHSPSSYSSCDLFSSYSSSPFSRGRLRADLASSYDPACSFMKLQSKHI
jgi:hypothetical protein